MEIRYYMHTTCIICAFQFFLFFGFQGKVAKNFYQPVYVLWKDLIYNLWILIFHVKKKTVIFHPNLPYKVEIKLNFLALSSSLKNLYIVRSYDRSKRLNSVEIAHIRVPPGVHRLMKIPVCPYIQIDFTMKYSYLATVHGIHYRQEAYRAFNLCPH